MILGLGHVARTGKDTAAAALVEDGWQHLAFADALRDLALVANPYIASIVASSGWEGAKSHTQINHVMEDLGKTVRKQFGADALIDAVFRQIELGRNVVISDVRYQSEVLGVRRAGGLLVRIDRPGVAPSRPSDRHLVDYLGWDATVVNDGSPDDLARAIRTIVSTLSLDQEIAR